MIKKFAPALILAVAAPLATGATATAAEDYPVRKIWGKGTNACPEKSVCLYRDINFNEGSHSGDGNWIWVVTGSAARIPGGNDEASSLYTNLDGTPWIHAALCKDTDFKNPAIYAADRAYFPDLSKAGINGQSNYNDTISSVEFQLPEDDDDLEVETDGDK